jgi:hypothetical protein
MLIEVTVEQQKMLLSIIDSVQIPGSLAEAIAELKRTILAGKHDEPSDTEQ